MVTKMAFIFLCPQKYRYLQRAMQVHVRNRLHLCLFSTHIKDYFWGLFYGKCIGAIL